MRISDLTDKPDQREPRPIVLWYLSEDHRAKIHAEGLIEEGHTYTLSNRYSARYDVAQQPNQKNHTHVYLKGNEVCVINVDGTPSHGSAPFSSLPAKIQTKIKSLKLVETSSGLLETASESRVLIPRSAMTMFWLTLLADK